MNGFAAGDQLPLFDLIHEHTAETYAGSGIRDPRDFYPTPFGLVQASLDLIPIAPAKILDPCAGTGVWGEIARQKWPDSHIEGCDLYFPDETPDYDLWYHGDFHRLEVIADIDLIMMNPPYGQKAHQFVQQGLKHLAPGGWLVALLLLGYVAAQRRAAFIFDEHRPLAIYTLPKRPSFRGAGGGSGTDKYNYMVAVWRKEPNPGDIVLRKLEWDYLPQDGRKRSKKKVQVTA